MGAEDDAHAAVVAELDRLRERFGIFRSRKLTSKMTPDLEVAVAKRTTSE